jgi:hypothetical protein
VHDALLIEAPSSELNKAVEVTKRAMAEASRLVLSGFELSTDATLVRSPDRYQVPRGEATWRVVMETLSDLGGMPTGPERT